MKFDFKNLLILIRHSFRSIASQQTLIFIFTIN